MNINEHYIDYVAYIKRYSWEPNLVKKKKKKKNLNRSFMGCTTMTFVINRILKVL